MGAQDGCKMACEQPTWPPRRQNGSQHGPKTTTRRPQGRPRGRLGGLLGRLGRVLEASWELFGSIFAGYSATLRAICENSKKPRKTNGFSLIFDVLGGLGGSENPKK